MPSKKPRYVYHIIAEKYGPKPGVEPMVSCLTYEPATTELSRSYTILLCKFRVYSNSPIVVLCVLCAEAGVVHVCR